MEITPEKLRKLQLLELKMLVEIKRVCEKHSIPFILIAGTLLGAVRHKGFIPWDDDIDIGMTRENFDRFCKIAPGDLSNEYFLQTPETDNTCGGYCCAKVRLNGTKLVVDTQPKNWKHTGFFVDILPYDSIPDSYFLGYCYWNIFNILIRAFWIRMGYHPHPKSLMARVIMRLGIVLCLPISTNRLKDILKNYHKKYKNLNSKNVVLLIGSWGFRKERHLRETILKISFIPFEGVLMPVPENYDLFLREQYGDYMTPPPVSSQTLRHAAEIDFGIYG
ncbi:LPS cholinephosphotransferase [Spirochaetia bacterium]|nr:LPS cholinephosphotransferase [Spirochaetia bacterium]